jgi:hypothetical protein
LLTWPEKKNSIVSCHPLAVVKTQMKSSIIRPSKLWMSIIISALVSHGGADAARRRRACLSFAKTNEMKTKIWRVAIPLSVIAHGMSRITGSPEPEYGVLLCAGGDDEVTTACRLINFLLLVLHCSPPIPAPHPSLSSICSLYIYIFGHDYNAHDEFEK